ncbi:MAG: WG repeat-containing protein [Bacteroidota bacterium]
MWNLRDRLCAVKKDGKWGAVDRLNNLVLKPEYDFVAMSPANDSLALVKDGDRWGVINQFNQKKLPIDFARVKYLNREGHALLEAQTKEGKMIYISNSDGSIQFESPSQENPSLQKLTEEGFENIRVLENGYLVAKKDGVYTFFNPQGNVLTKAEFLDIRNLGDGLVTAQLNHKKAENRKYGYLNIKGEEVIPFEYEEAQPFSEGLAWVKTLKRGKWSLINKKGEVLLKARYREATPFVNGRAIVENRKIISPDNKVLAMLPKAKVIGQFSKGSIPALGKAGYFHLTDEGEPLYNARFDSVTTFVNDVAFAKVGTRWGLRRLSVSAKGEVVIPFSTPQKLLYQDKYKKKRVHTTKYGDRFRDEGWEKLQDGHWRMISKDGRYLSNVKYSSIEGWEKPYLQAAVGSLYGIADLNGNWIAEPMYESRAYLPENILRLETSDAIHYLHISGKWIWKGE